MKTKKSFKFNEPRPKKYVRVSPQQPYPIPLSNSSETKTNNALWWTYEGYLNGNSVIIEEAHEVQTLSNLGFFGRTTLPYQSTKSFKSSSESIDPTTSSNICVLERRRFNRHKEWLELTKCQTAIEQNSDRDPKNKSLAVTASDDSTLSCSNKEQEKDIIVLEDSDPEDLSTKEIDTVTEKWKPTLQKDPYSLSTALHLMLEEAFFLMYGLGCLSVKDENKKCLNIISFWKYCCQKNCRFPVTYATYHYFRSKGWVVKSGLTFGFDFCLYKQGPPFYHASFVISVIPVEKDTLSEDPLFPSKAMTWTNLSGLNRSSEQVAKEVIFSHVIRPADLTLEIMHSSPACLENLQVQEILLRRWIPKQERDNINLILPSQVQ